MPRSRTRALNNPALLEEIQAEFEKKRKNPEAFVALLCRLGESDHCVWAIARSAARKNPLDDSEKAMIAQIVAPHLAGMTSGSVYRRHKLAE